MRAPERGDWAGRELHFIAIGGAGMSALALVAAGLGARVSGSDRSESTYLERLRAAGLEPRVGHDADQVPASADVVVSTAIPEDNPELLIARERGQRIIHRGELLAELAGARRLLAVAGTHGKTTSSGMAAWALRRLGADPSFVIGGELPEPEDGGAVNGRIGAGEWLIAEADESDGSFLRLRPEIALVTNVELDHHDRWGSRAELIEAFRAFAEPASGLAIAAEPGLEAIAAGHSTVERFDADRPGPEPRLAVPGAHNRLNARGVMAALGLCGFDPAEVGAALADFPGMGRRQEFKGELRGARIYDDYAHHPTEVAATLEAFRELAPRRLIALFQPHLYSRTKAFAARFGAALAAADAVGVLDVYAARESPVGELAGVSGLDVARATAERSGGRPVWWLADHDRAARFLAGELRDGDLLVTIGAGDVFKVGEALAAHD
ncbi:UDP-N-acetylmuramate--L-alanine ligase [Thermoleophilia bacterium SCSIO 60948]|nr:UDP-N-acetylmuramate--L-alanine ligase [Thermoleophilia bacterium SCSIO 60948]